jgi:hypothetical protein
MFQLYVLGQHYLTGNLKGYTFLADQVVIFQQTLLFAFASVELLPFVKSRARSDEQASSAMRSIRLT